MNPFHKKSPLEKLGDSLGDVVKRIPRALSSRRRRSEAPGGDA